MGLPGARPEACFSAVCADAPAANADAQTNAQAAFLMLDVMSKSTLPQPA
jgi:hypothetical protein